MRIQHNIMAMNAYRNYNTNTSALSKNLEKLSSGYKINRAGDDAAGLAISEKMRAQITGLNAAQKNVKDGISLVKTAEGAMQEIQDMLNRMDYLATQSANGTYDNEVDRYNLQKEVNQLRSEINRIADSANFNGIKLLDGSLAEAAGSTVALTANVDATVTGGQPGGGGAITLGTANFPTGGTYDQHAGSSVIDQATVAFTIDLAGMTAKASDDNTTLTIKLGGTAIVTLSGLVSNGGSAGDGLYDAAGIAGLVTASMTVAIEGVTFNVAVSGEELNLTLASGETYTASVADQLNAYLGNDVEFASSDTSKMTFDDKAVDHGIKSITKAEAANAGAYAGIDFKITEDLMGEGKELKIGDTTFIFHTDATVSAATADATNKKFVVDVSGKTTAAEQAKEAMRLITTSTGTDGMAGYDGTITHTNDAGVTTTFNVSSTGEDIIHVDQKPQATGAGQPANQVYSIDDLKKLFSASNPTTAAVAGSLELTPTISVDAAAGDRLSFGDGKTYIIAEAGDKNLSTDIAADQANEKVSEIYLTAASFNEELSKYAMAEAAKAGVATTNAAGADKYAVSTAADGKVTITAKEAADRGTVDTSAYLNNIKTAVDNYLSSFTVNKLTEDDLAAKGLKLQIGDTSDTFNQLSVKVGDMHTNSMGTMEAAVKGGKETPAEGKSISDIDISTPEGAHEAIDIIKNAINYVSSIRGDLGATQNRLEHTANNLSVMAENIQDAESTIRDTDVAEEMMAYTKNNILVQSAQAMLAQANAVPQGVLQLLG